MIKILLLFSFRLNPYLFSFHFRNTSYGFYGLGLIHHPLILFHESVQKLYSYPDLKMVMSFRTPCTLDMRHGLINLCWINIVNPIIPSKPR